MSEYSDSNNFNSNPLREDLINTAVKFLRNPKVASSTSDKKYKFLQNKGLTENEITRAFSLASIELPINNKTEYTAVSIPVSNNDNKNNKDDNSVNNSNLVQSQPKFIKAVKDFFNITAFFGTTLYCFYWCYKKFIEPFFFKSKSPPAKSDEKNEELLTDIKEMKKSISKLEEKVDKMTVSFSPDPSVPLLIQEMKTDLTSLKGLLLSRKQFPSAPVTVTIPSWQLDDNSNQNREKTTEDDAASGSSANNSDSSLEMIRE